MILTINNNFTNSFLFVSFLANLWRLDVKNVDLIKIQKARFNCKRSFTRREQLNDLVLTLSICL